MFFICTSIFLVLASWLYLARSRRYWARRGVKSPPVSSFNIFGNFTDCILARKALRDYLTDLYRWGEGEKFVGFYVFDKPYLLLRDPEVVKCVLIKDFKNFANRHIAGRKDDFMGHWNIFTLRNPGWRVVRHKLTPVFTSQKLKNMFDAIVDAAKEMDDYMGKNVREGEQEIIFVSK